jgi:hypothetical protein
MITLIYVCVEGIQCLLAQYLLYPLRYFARIDIDPLSHFPRTDTVSASPPPRTDILYASPLSTYCCCTRFSSLLALILYTLLHSLLSTPIHTASKVRLQFPFLEYKCAQKLESAL